MKPLRVILQTFFVLIGMTLVYDWCAVTQTTVFNITPTSNIASVLAQAGSTSGQVTVNFAAGNYNITSKITLPCSQAGGSITFQGVPAAYRPPSNFLPGTYSYSTPYTTNFVNGFGSGDWGFATGVCSSSSHQTIQYFNWDGAQPSGGGGGFINVSYGTNNVTIQNNYIHGNWANINASHDSDTSIFVGDSVLQPSPITTNVTIQWNVIGDGKSDCNAVYSLFSYQGGNYEDNGGTCTGVAVRGSNANLIVRHNAIEHQEQGFKGIESGQNFNSATLMINPFIQYNDVGQWHRIGMESQMAIAASTTVGSVVTWQYNSFHDCQQCAYASWILSAPQCCSSFIGYYGNGYQTITDNFFLGNLPGVTYYPGIEFWSGQDANSTASYNVAQGFVGTSYNSSTNTGSGGGLVQWGCTPSRTQPIWSASNNLFQAFATTGTVGTVQNEGNQGSTCIENPEIVPTQAGNVLTQGPSNIKPLVSATPTISPNPSAISVATQVTITDNGYTYSGYSTATVAIARGNTNVIYTTNGTNPTATNGTWCASPCVITVNPGATVKYAGLWGSLNQPHVWPSPSLGVVGWGWIPSAVQTATYTSSGPAPTLNSVTVTGQTNSITVGSGTTDQLTAKANYSDGSSPDVSAIANWVTSSTAICTVNSTGGVSPVSQGNCNVTATYNSVTSAPFAITVNPAAAAPTLTSAQISVAVTTIQQGSSVQFSALCKYSDTSSFDCGTTADRYGNRATFTSSKPSVGTINSVGSFTGISVGTSIVSATVGGLNATPTITETVQNLLMGKPIGRSGAWMR